MARRKELQGWKQHLNKLNSIKQCYRTSVEELKQYYSTVGLKKMNVLILESLFLKQCFIPVKPERKKQPAAL